MLLVSFSKRLAKCPISTTHSKWKIPEPSFLIEIGKNHESNHFCKNYQIGIWILAFSTNFCRIKTELSGNTVWPQAPGFQKLAKMCHLWHFWLTFVHSKCKRSSLRSQCWMRLFLWFSNTVRTYVACTTLSTQFLPHSASVQSEPTLNYTQLRALNKVNKATSQFQKNCEFWISYHRLASPLHFHI